VQADSGSDSDSESRNKHEEIIPVNRLTQTVRTDPPAPATTIRTRTDKQRTFFVATLGIGVGTWICLHCRLAPTLGIGVGTWICLHCRLAPTLGIGVGTWICLHCRLAPTLGIGVGTWICLHCRLVSTLGIGVGTWICLHYTRTLALHGNNQKLRCFGRHTSLSDRSLFTLCLWRMTSAVGDGPATVFVININVCIVPRIESVIPL
jgi:hypothetical protein